MLPPRTHVSLLWDELGGVAMIGFQEVNGFLPFGEPKFVLGHKGKCHKKREPGNAISISRANSQSW